MPLLAQDASQKMRAAARLHTNQLNLQIRGESQQLPTGTSLADHHLPRRIHAHEMENRFTQIDADYVKSWNASWPRTLHFKYEIAQ